MNNENSPLKVFWSWQSDSPPNQNRNLIEDCLKKAIKKIGQEDAIILEIDRDTKGVGGTPSIAEVILSKIRIADIFLWDATIVSTKPRPAPNPNVLFELGYAISILGDGRIIGIMNISNGLDGNTLPFDLKHRRWPITYSFVKPTEIKQLLMKIIPSIALAFSNNRKKVKDILINDIVNALKVALNEPKIGALNSDVDFQVAKSMWSLIDSSSIKNWYEWRIDHPQFEYTEYMENFYNYLDKSSLPEKKYNNEELSHRHNSFLESLSMYTYIAAIEMIPDGDKAYVISTKRTSELSKEDYDKNYERQCNALIVKINKVWETWKDYVEELRTRYPEIIE